MSKPYVIHDWAGNHVFQGESFSTFEDAWEFIYTQFPEQDEETLGEYFVEME